MFLFAFPDLPIIKDVLEAASILNTKWRVIYKKKQYNRINFDYFSVDMFYLKHKHLVYCCFCRGNKN